MDHGTAIIIGAGPAGLTAGYELLSKTALRPIIFENSELVGGISKTVNHNGNRIDIGGHRFFSKSDRVMEWWQNILPRQGSPSRDDLILRRPLPLALCPDAPDPEKTDRVMLVRNRISRILYLRKFFDYPISVNKSTLSNLGAARVIKIAASYMRAILAPVPESTLEDFLTNRFGSELYRTFFKDYTEKVWGISPGQIGREWGAQRIKGLSIKKALLHCLKKAFNRDDSVAQKETETSLIERFLYPKFGPGQMWEEVAGHVTRGGGKIHVDQKIIKVETSGKRVVSVTARDNNTGIESAAAGDLFFSSMPVKDLIVAMGAKVPHEVKETALGLVYRDFITVGVLLKRLRIRNETGIATVNNIIPDNWIYVQEADVKVGRIQIFNNWSPYMVSDLDTVWIGLEYFCQEDDNLWSRSDEYLVNLAMDELVHLGFIEKDDFLDAIVLRVPKAYPGYFGSYDRFDVIRNYLDSFENLYLIGRNGMHRYNNQDHSMLSAMIAVDNIVTGREGKENIWSVNSDGEYHENK